MPSRNSGLDLLRCCAIMPVLIYHSPLVNGFLEQLGYIGVEIFFSLSGFLVLKMIAERFDKIQSFEALVMFLTNRWMRTLPLYFIFIGINVAIACNWSAINPHNVPVFGTFTEYPQLWPFFTFTQNMFTGGKDWSNNWFGVSWSLSLEEWFYILFPTLLLMFRAPSFMRLAIRLLVAIILASIAARSIRYATSTHGNVEDLFRRPVLFRLDAFCYGALMQLFMSSRAEWLRAHRGSLLATGASILLFALFNGPTPDKFDFFSSTIYFALVPFAVALTIPAFYHLHFRWPIPKMVTYFISSRTYAVYLCHLPVGVAFSVLAGPFTMISLVPLMLAQFIVADLLYRLIERPIMRLRPHSVAFQQPAGVTSLGLA